SPFGPPSSHGSDNGLDGALDGSHVYADNGAFTVVVTVRDDEGSSATTSFQVVVSNAAPSVAVGGDRTINEGQSITIAGTLSDPGTLDIHTVSIDWGDGSALDTPAVTDNTSGPPGSTSGMT